MSSGTDRFWITDLHRGRDVEIGRPLSIEADEFLREVHELGTSRKTVDGRRVECRAHDNDWRLREFQDADGQVHDIWMYVQWKNGRWVICHYPFERKNVKFTDHVVPRTDSPDHRKMKDGLQEAFEAGGCEVIQELRVEDRQYDVFATVGGRSFAIECDHTTRDLRTARAKEKKDQRLGVAATIFCSDRDAPPYADRVPHAEITHLPYRNGRPDIRTWPIARGPRVMEFHRCKPGSVFTTGCPEHRSRQRGAQYCGGEHPFLRQSSDSDSKLSIADLGERVPAGELVVVRPEIQKVEACVMRADDATELEQYLAQRIPGQREAPGRRAGGRHLRSVDPSEMRKRRGMPAATVPPPPVPGGQDTEREELFLAEPGRMRARWWSRCRGCDQVVHGPGTEDLPCPCGVRHVRGQPVGLADLPGQPRAWVCEPCFVRLAP